MANYQDSIPSYHTPKKGNLELCQSCRTISLISHTNKVMLKIILKWLQSPAEEIIAKDQAGFNAGRNRTHIQSSADPQREMPAVSAENQACLLTGYGTKPYGQLWGNTSSMPKSFESLKICMPRLRDGSTDDWFRTTVGVRQGYLLSQTHFNIFLERIVCEALDDDEGSVSIGRRFITNFCFADNCRKRRRGRRSWRLGRSSWYNHQKVQYVDWSRQDESDDKQPKMASKERSR